MTRHIVALAVLLFAAPVGAVELKVCDKHHLVDGCVEEPDGRRFIYDAKTGMFTSCYVRMEAAMKAVEPYIVGPVDQAKRSQWEAVLDQWYVAKRACWREQ